MNKGLLFALPIIATAIVVYVLDGMTDYAPMWSALTLLGGLISVFFYIRNQKHNERDTGSSGKE